MSNGKDMVTTEEAAAILERTAKTVRRWRVAGRGPQPVKLVGRIALYDRQEVEEFARKLREVGE